MITDATRILHEMALLRAQRDEDWIAHIEQMARLAEDAKTDASTVRDYRHLVRSIVERLKDRAADQRRHAADLAGPENLPPADPTPAPVKP